TPPSRHTPIPYTTSFRSEQHRSQPIAIFWTHARSSGGAMDDFGQPVSQFQRREGGDLHAERREAAGDFLIVHRVRLHIERRQTRSEEHTSELQSPYHLVC